MKNKDLLIIGSGGHARVILETAALEGIATKGILDVNFSGDPETILGAPVLGNLNVMDSINPEEVYVFIALGGNSERRQISELISRKGFSSITLVHPTAIVSKSANLAAGTFVAAGAIINPQAKIGEGTIINTGALIDHETRIGKFSHIGPGTTVCGRVNIGANSFIGAGVTIIDKISIGESVTVGAGSVVIADIPSGTTNVGSPSRTIK